MKKTSIAIVCLLALGLSSTPVRAQGITQQQAEEILQELRAIHQLLQKMQLPAPAAAQPAAPAPDPHVKMATVTGYMLGRPDAPLTMVEFTDLQCPFCARFATTTFDQIKKDWIDTGKLRFVTRDFPLDFHPEAKPAARAVRCAADQGKFWELRTALGRNADKLSPDFITATAQSLGLDMKTFAACTAGTEHDAEIARDQQEGAALGVSGTPTFIVGRTAGQGLDGIRIVGAQPYATFDQKLKELSTPAK